jgi:aminoglycoside 3-N-acetyltransferase
MKRPGVLRSWHPTHSVAALGSKAKAFIQGEEACGTPCPREGCWGKLYDRGAKIIFIGCSLRRNTIIHGVEEWNHIPTRLTEYYQPLKILTPHGELIERPLRRHYHPLCDVSENYGKIEAPLLKNGIAKLGRIGDAKTYLCDARKMVDLVTDFLKNNPRLFENNEPIPTDWYC